MEMGFTPPITRRQHEFDASKITKSIDFVLLKTDIEFLTQITPRKSNPHWTII